MYAIRSYYDMKLLWPMIISLFLSTALLAKEEIRQDWDGEGTIVLENDGSNGKKPKYLQRKDSGNRLYIPHPTRYLLNDSYNVLSCMLYEVSTLGLQLLREVDA